MGQPEIDPRFLNSNLSTNLLVLNVSLKILFQTKYFVGPHSFVDTTVVAPNEVDIQARALYT